MCGNDPETPGQDSRESSTSQPNGTTSSRRGWSDTISATVKKVTQWAGLGICGPGRKSEHNTSRTAATTRSDHDDDRRVRAGRQSGESSTVGNDTTEQSGLTSNPTGWELPGMSAQPELISTESLISNSQSSGEDVAVSLREMLRGKASFG